MSLAVDVEVYELDGTRVGSLTHGAPGDGRQVRALSGETSADENGDGAVIVDYDHPQEALLTGDRVLRVTETLVVDEVPTPRKRYEFLVRNRDTVVKPDSKLERDRLITASGDGLLAVLADIRTLGTLPPGVKPQSSRRLWGGAAPETPRGTWATPHEQTRATSDPQRPWDMPSQFARWLWTRTEPSDPEENHPIEGAWFHTTFTVPEVTPVVFVQTADDSFRQFLQGVELQVEERDYPSDVWHWPYTAGVECSPGVTYHYVVYAHNDAGRGASLTEIWQTGPNGIETALRLSGTGVDAHYGVWKCLIQDDDDPYPGCTPGLILTQYLAEGQARGEGLHVEMMFDADVDSNGEPWASSPEQEYSNEGNLHDVFTTMTETLIDGWADLGPDGVRIYATNKGTRGATGKFNVTANQVVSHKVTDNWSEIENSVLVVSEKTAIIVGHDESIDVNGPRPAKAPIRTGKVTDERTMRELGEAYLAPRAWPGRTRAIEVTPMTEFDADPGDSGTVDGVPDLQVASIKLELEHGGLLRKVPVFETAYQRAIRDSTRRVDRLLRDAGAMGSVRIIDGGTQIKTGRIGSVKLVSWGFDYAEDLEFIEWDLDDEPSWRRYVVDEKARLCRCVISADTHEPDGDGGSDKVTTGDTQIQVLINSQPIPSTPWYVTLGENQTEVHSQLWGPALILPGTKLSIAGAGYGGHINGTVTLYASDPL